MNGKLGFAENRRNLRRSAESGLARGQKCLYNAFEVPESDPVLVSASFAVSPPERGVSTDTFSEPRDTFSAQLGSAPPPMSPHRHSCEGASYEPPLLDWVSLEVWVILSVLQ